MVRASREVRNWGEAAWVRNGDGQGRPSHPDLGLLSGAGVPARLPPATAHQLASAYEDSEQREVTPACLTWRRGGGSRSVEFGEASPPFLLS